MTNHASSFDERAATWDDPQKIARAADVAHAIRGAVPLGPTVRMLEYGAGTGLVTQALRSWVGPVTLADTSAGMREVMAQKVADGSLPDARIWDVDLASSPAPDERFDLIVTVMTLHHIDDLGPVLGRFASLLEPGGHLCVVDLEAEDGSFHQHPDAVHEEGFHVHHGFERDDLARDLTAAGFGEITFDVCHEIQREDRTFPLFLATATRLPAS